MREIGERNIRLVTMREIQLDESLSGIKGYIDVQVLQLVAILLPIVNANMIYGKYTLFAIATPDYEPLNIWNFINKDITVLIIVILYNKHVYQNIISIYINFTKLY